MVLPAALFMYSCNMNIGWDQVFRGHISHHWGKANFNYCKERRLHNDSQLADMWMERVVSDMWQFGIDSWINRGNEAIYR